LPNTSRRGYVRFKGASFGITEPAQEVGFMEDLQADPTAMRTRAAAMRQSAESLRALGQRIDRRVEGLRFEGPAAMRFRAAAAERSQRAMGAAHRLDELAERVQSEAVRAEQQADRRAGGA
jgi:uncharacterized protein YukE